VTEESNQAASGPDPAHQTMREMLWSYVLGHLRGEEAAACRAHLEECAACRAELAELGSLTALLARLDQTSVEALPPAPPPSLIAAIREQIIAERAAAAAPVTPVTLVTPADQPAPVDASTEAQLRRTSRWRVMVAAAAVIAVVGVGGGVVGRNTGPELPTVPREDIALAPVAGGAGADVQIVDAFLVNHTWGVEMRIEASGFARGKVFRAAFRDERGRWVPAGEFIGVGADSMVCNLQAAALREDVTEVAVMNAKGTIVASATL
jgi:anti-sigma-K factor RskA